MELKKHTFFTHFPPELAKELLSHAQTVTVQTGEVLFDEGEPSDSLYLVLSGKIELRKQTVSNKFLTLAFAQEGDYFGELGVLDGNERSAMAIAWGESHLARIPRDKLIPLLSRAPWRTLVDMFLRVSGQLRATNNRVVTEVVRKEKMALVGEMADSIIHDFRGPFTTIQLACELIRNNQKDKDTAKWCEMIEHQIRRMVGMVNEVLEFSRGSPVLDPKPISIKELFGTFYSFNQFILQRNTVELILKGSDDVINIDSDKILRVMQNLFNNAMEASDGKSSRIEITSKKYAQGIEIHLSDNGPGIPEEISDQLFEPFVTRGKRGGTGLGLAIAKAIVEAHGGELTYESQPGRGTTFILRFPREIIPEKS